LIAQKFETDIPDRRTTGFFQLTAVCLALVKSQRRNGAVLPRHEGLSPEHFSEQIVNFLKTMTMGRSVWGDDGLLAKVVDHPEMNMRFDYATSRPGFACTVGWGKL
jgi:hypothetical protein